MTKLTTSGFNIKLMATILLSLLFSANVDSKETDKKASQAPFGVKFGQKFVATEHDTILRRGNVRSVKLKTRDRPDDTEELRAEICEEYGLQVVTWRSHIRSLSAAATRHKEIAKDFTEKYGKPKLKRGSAFWKAKGFIVVAKIRSTDKIHQNQIRYFGPKNEPCFERLMIHQQKQ